MPDEDMHALWAVGVEETRQELEQDWPVAVTLR
jgi:hypothetical protein